MGHAQGLEDPLLGEGVERFSADLLDDLAEQEVAGVGIGEFPAGGIVELLLAQDDVARFLDGRAVRLRPESGEGQQAVVITDPAGVMDQVVDRDRLLISPHPGEELADVVGRADLPFPDEDGDAGGRELLGDRADVEDLGGRIGHAVLDAGHPVAALVDDRAVANDG